MPVAVQMPGQQRSPLEGISNALNVVNGINALRDRSRAVDQAEKLAAEQEDPNSPLLQSVKQRAGQVGIKIPDGMNFRQAKEAGLLTAIEKQAETMAKNQADKRHRDKIPATEVQQLSGADSAIKQLSDLDAIMSGANDISGPGVLSGWKSKLQGKFQIGDTGRRAASLQAASDATAQAIGTYLEHGKLTDADFENKYKPMMPSITDAPEVRQNKKEYLARLIAQRQQADLKNLGGAGYDVSGLGANAAPERISLAKGQPRHGGGESAGNSPLLESITKATAGGKDPTISAYAKQHGLQYGEAEGVLRARGYGQ